MALVGERGPELVFLPQGASVLPHRETAMAMGGVFGSGRRPIVVQVVLDGRIIAQTQAIMAEDEEQVRSS